MTIDTEVPAPAPIPFSATQPLYWSLRRELWENRSVYLAPLIVAAIVLFASLVSTLGLPRRLRALPDGDRARQTAVVMAPYKMAPAPIMLTSFIVGFFYALDALYGERRDRSILFWKSLPVSDRTTVLAKVLIPLAVLPLIAFVLSIIVVGIIAIQSTILLTVSGISPVTLWSELRIAQEPPVMLYGLTVHALWFAPIYGWLLLVSVWSRRTPVLWAALPLLAISVFERIVFHTSRFGSLLRYRLSGAMTRAFTVDHRGSIDEVWQLEPLRFLSTPGLWLGLLFAAAAIAATIRLRRSREPI